MLRANYASIPEIRPKNSLLKIIGFAIPVVILGIHLHKRYNFFGLKKHDDSGRENEPDIHQH